MNSASSVAPSSSLLASSSNTVVRSSIKPAMSLPPPISSMPLANHPRPGSAFASAGTCASSQDNAMPNSFHSLGSLTPGVRRVPSSMPSASIQSSWQHAAKIDRASLT